jgi:tetratricopeptide (TPR) repeat protein
VSKIKAAALRVIMACPRHRHTAPFLRRSAGVRLRLARPAAMPASLRERGNAAFAAGEWAEAVALYAEAIAEAPEPDAVLHRCGAPGWGCGGRGFLEAFCRHSLRKRERERVPLPSQPKASHPSSPRAPTSSPRVPPTHSNRSAALLKAGDAAAALADADVAARLRPRWEKAHWRRGMALEALGRGQVVCATEASFPPPPGCCCRTTNRQWF